MSQGVPPAEPAGAMTPAGREARWTLSARFAIGAASLAGARAILGQALAGLDEKLPLQGEPTMAQLRSRDGIWVALLVPDLTGLVSIEPDDARTRCRYVAGHFGGGVTWMSRGGQEAARWDWPPDIWSRSPGDDVLLHPAMQAVMILCEARDGRPPGSLRASSGSWVQNAADPPQP
jgi:hypothetical protein